MAKRKIDFGDYKENEYEEYTGEDPKVGAWYTGEVVRCKYDDEGDQLIFYIVLRDNDLYEGWTRAWYAPFEGTQKWKAQEIIRAIQGGATKDVELDWENEKAVATWLKKAKRIRFQTDEYNEKVRIRKVRPLLESAGGPSTGPKPAAPAPAAEPADLEDDALEDYTEEELGEMTVDGLTEILEEEFEAEVPKKGRRETEDAYKTKLITLILEEQAAEGDPEEEGEVFTEEQLGEKSDEELKAILEEMGEPVPAKGRRDKPEAYTDKLIDAILDAQDADPGADGDAPTEQNDDPEFDEGFADDAADPEPEPEPAPRARRSRAAAAAPEPAAPATRTRRARK